MASIYPRDGFLVVSFKDATGRWRGAKTKFRVGEEEQARVHAEQVQKHFDALRAATKGSVITVKIWADRWFLMRAENGVKSVKDDKSRITTHILKHIGTRDIRTVTKADIQKIFESLRAKHKEAQAPGAKVKMSSATIRAIYAATVVMFSDAKALDLITTSPVELPSHAMPTVRKKKTRRYLLGELETVLLCGDIPHDRRVLYSLLALTGARFGEVAALRWSDLNFNAEPLACIAIDKSYSTHRHQVGETKTEVERKSPVHSLFAPVLRWWWNEGFETSYGHAPQPSDLVVPSRGDVAHASGERNSNHALKKLRKDLTRAGISEVSERKLHAFRTTFISLMRNAGVDKDEVREITHGTTSNDVIDAHYTRWDWETLCKAVESIPFQRLNADNFVASFQPVSTDFQPPAILPELLAFVRVENGGVDGTRSLGFCANERNDTQISAEITVLQQPGERQRNHKQVTVEKFSTTQQPHSSTVEYGRIHVICEGCEHEADVEQGPGWTVCIYCGGNAYPLVEAVSMEGMDGSSGAEDAQNANSESNAQPKDRRLPDLPLEHWKRFTGVL